MKPVEQDGQEESAENSIATIHSQIKLLEKRTQKSINDSTHRLSVEVGDLNTKVAK